MKSATMTRNKRWADCAEKARVPTCSWTVCGQPATCNLFSKPLVFCYRLFAIPTGWLGDRFGARNVLLRVVLWWSFFTAATGWVGGLVSLIFTRAMFGIGEAGCFPNLTKAFTIWLPQAERVRAQGIMWLSARWGGAFTPLLVAWILQYVSWRRAFELFAVIGVVWAC